MSLARQSSSVQDENAATEMRHLTMRSLPFSLPTWIFWHCRRCSTTDLQPDCGGNCIATFHTCWVMLGGMAGKAAAPGSNSWTVGWCWPAATQFWMHAMSATPMGEGRMHWQPRERCLPRLEASLYYSGSVLLRLLSDNKTCPPSQEIVQRFRCSTNTANSTTYWGEGAGGWMDSTPGHRLSSHSPLRIFSLV